MIDRRDRFKMLEAARREKEGLPDLRANESGPEISTPRRHQEAQSPNSSRKRLVSLVSWINLLYFFSSTDDSFTWCGNSVPPQFSFTRASFAVERYIISLPAPVASRSQSNTML